MTYAVYNSLIAVEVWDTLTKDSWNQMITNQVDFDTRLNSITTTWTWDFVRISAYANIWSNATNTWTWVASCPVWYSIINWWASNSIMYWWAMTHWYASCNQENNWVKASLYNQNGYTWHCKLLLSYCRN